MISLVFLLGIVDIPFLIHESVIVYIVVDVVVCVAS
jgi:hypothetical protein